MGVSALPEAPLASLTPGKRGLSFPSYPPVIPRIPPGAPTPPPRLRVATGLEWDGLSLLLWPTNDLSLPCLDIALPEGPPLHVLLQNVLQPNVSISWNCLPGHTLLHQSFPNPGSCYL